jgi:hypothetical protein
LDLDRQASATKKATSTVSFLGLAPANAGETVSYFAPVHRGATWSGSVSVVSIERGTSRRRGGLKRLLAHDVHRVQLVSPGSTPGGGLKKLTDSSHPDYDPVSPGSTPGGGLKRVVHEDTDHRPAGLPRLNPRGAD